MTAKPRLDLDKLEKQNSIRHKFCTYCGVAIPRSSELSCCARCQETFVFQEVREYIRQNNVNEFQVAEHFNIPLGVVKHWMKEHRIEYTNGNYPTNIFYR